MQSLLNELEITKQLGRYARIIDGKRFEDASQVFAEDVTFDYGLGQEERGLTALKHLFRRFLEKCGPPSICLAAL